MVLLNTDKENKILDRMREIAIDSYNRGAEDSKLTIQETMDAVLLARPNTTASELIELIKGIELPKA